MTFQSSALSMQPRIDRHGAGLGLSLGQESIPHGTGQIPQVLVV
jgi:hypothetical protein